VVVVAWGMRLLCLAFVSQMAGVVLFFIGGGVVAGGLQPLGEWLCMGAGLCQLGSEGGTAGRPGGSPLVCSCSPVVIWHTSHPLFEGRRVVVVGLALGGFWHVGGLLNHRKLVKKI
jgi:hypothetical protein